MKYLMFIILLSFTLCLATSTQEAYNGTKLDNSTSSKLTETVINSNTESKDNTHEKSNNVTSAGTKAEETNITTNNKQMSSTIDNQTIQEGKSITDKAIDKKGGEVTTKTDKHVTEPVSDKQSTTKNETTTAKVVPSTNVTTTTVKPVTEPVSDKTPAPLEARGFSGSSFVGGMILTLGMMAIGFIGYKYYMSERDYHTL